MFKSFSKLPTPIWLLAIVLLANLFQQNAWAAGVDTHRKYMERSWKECTSKQRVDKGVYECVAHKTHFEYSYYINDSKVSESTYNSSLINQPTRYEISQRKVCTLTRTRAKSEEQYCARTAIETKYFINDATVGGNEFYTAQAIDEVELQKKENLKHQRVLKNWEVQTYIDGYSFFLEPLNDSNFLYDKIQFFNQDTPQDGFPGYLTGLKTGNDDATVDISPAPNPGAWTPIGVGGITIFVQASDTIRRPRSTRRLGTSAVELHLVREQIRKLTERSWLQGHADMEDYLLTLYSNGQNFGLGHDRSLKIGQALSPDEQWNVPRDMIWPEYHVVDGQTVLVPSLYLTQSTYAANDLSGAQVIATNVDLQYGDFTVDGGEIVARRNLLLQAANNIHNSEGSIQAGGELWAQAGGSLQNLSGTISGEDVTLIADSITSETLVVRTDHAYGYADTAQSLATVTAMGDLVVQANGDILVAGSEVSANGDISLKSSNGSIAIVSVPESEYFSDSGTAAGGDVSWSLGFSEVAQIQSQLSGEDISLLAAETISVSGGVIHAEGDLRLLAGLGIYIIDAEHQSSSSYSFAAETGGAFGTEETADEESAKTEIVRSLLTAGNDIALRTLNGDITLKGVDLTTDAALLIEAPNGALHLQLAIGQDYYSYAESSTGTLVFSNSGHGQNIETAVYNQLNAQGGVVFDAGTGIYVEYTGDLLTLDENLDVLAAQPGLGWINELRNSHSVAWEQFKPVHEEWRYSNQGLTEAGAALLQIAVMAATAGFDFTTLVTDAGISNSSLNAAVNAGSQTLISQTGHALVANGFDPLATLNQLGSSDSIKALVSSMATAGTMQGLDAFTDNLFTLDSGALGLTGDSLNYTNQALGRLQQATLNATVRGGSIDDALKEDLVSNFVDWAAASAAYQIGDFAVKSALEQNSEILTEGIRMLQHAALGCAVGSIRNDDCHSGAFGAVAAESLAQLSAGFIDPDNTMSSDELEQQVHIYSMLGTMLLAELSGRDIMVAQNTGSNAVANNYLKHEEQEAFAGELDGCDDNFLIDTPEYSSCLRATFARYQVLSDQNNVELKAAYDSCLGGGSSARSDECQTYIRLVSEGTVWLTRNFHDLEFVRHTNALNQHAGSYWPEQMEASLNRALSGNLNKFEVLVGRQLGDEIVIRAGNDYPMYESYETLLTTGIDFESAITAEHEKMVVQGIAIVAAGEGSGWVLAQGARVAGTWLISNSGKVLGQVKKSDAGDDILHTAHGDFNLDNDPDFERWLKEQFHFDVHSARKRVRALRAGIPSSHRFRGNAAIADVHIDGLSTKTMSAHSGIDVVKPNHRVEDLVGDGMENFTSIVIPNAAGHPIDRVTDAEYKILALRKN